MFYGFNAAATVRHTSTNIATMSNSYGYCVVYNLGHNAIWSPAFDDVGRVHNILRQKVRFMVISQCYMLQDMYLYIVLIGVILAMPVLYSRYCDKK